MRLNGISGRRGLGSSAFKWMGLLFAAVLVVAGPTWDLLSGDENLDRTGRSSLHPGVKEGRFVSSPSPGGEPSVASVATESAQTALPSGSADDLKTPLRPFRERGFLGLNRTVRGQASWRKPTGFVGRIRQLQGKPSNSADRKLQFGRPDPVAFAPSQSGYLRSLEDRHRAVAGNLFGGLPLGIAQAQINPFQGALEEAGGSVSDSGTPAPSPPSSATPTDSSPAAEAAPQTPSSPGNPPGDSGVSVGASEPATGSREQVGAGNQSQPDQQPGVEESRRTFLVVGDFSDFGTSRRAFLAERDEESGAFLLENQIPFDPFLSIVGIPRAAAVLQEGQQLVTADLNGDRIQDFLRVTPGFPATSVEALLRISLARFTPVATGSVFFQSIKSLALFDIDGDGVQELALLMEQSPNLFVYDIDGDTIQYSRELVLPFEPAFLVEVDGPQRRPIPERRLYISDRNLTRTVYMSSRLRGNLLVPGALPSGQIQPFRIAAPASGRFHLDLLLLQFPERILIYQEKDNRVLLMADLETRSGVPNLIFGDFQDTGAWELVYLP